MNPSPKKESVLQPWSALKEILCHLQLLLVSVPICIASADQNEDRDHQNGCLCESSKDYSPDPSSKTTNMTFFSFSFFFKNTVSCSGNRKIPLHCFKQLAYEISQQYETKQSICSSKPLTPTQYLLHTICWK